MKNESRVIEYNGSKLNLDYTRNIICPVCGAIIGKEVIDKYVNSPAGGFSITWKPIYYANAGKVKVQKGICKYGERELAVEAGVICKECEEDINKGDLQI